MEEAATSPARPSPGPPSYDDLLAEVARLRAENAGLRDDLAARDAALAVSQEQQAATAEVLRVIASSPTDIDRVLHAITKGAARLCEEPTAVLQRLRARDGRLALSAIVGSAADEVLREYGPNPFVNHPGVELSRDSLSGRAFLDRQTIVVANMAEAVQADLWASRPLQQRWGYRSAVAVPLIQQGESVGVLMLMHPEIRPFTDREIALLETFADQAVIAIENARLFAELEQRNRELSETLAGC